MPSDRILVRRRFVQMRFSGQDSTLQVEWRPGRDLGEAFAEQHLALFGHRPDGRAVEVESLRVMASSRRDEQREPTMGAVDGGPRPAPRLRTARVRFGGRWLEVPCYDQAALRPGHVLESPSLVLDDCATTVVEPGWSARVDGSCAVVMEGVGQGQGQGQGQGEHAAVRMELFVGRVEAVAEEMGEVLQRTALSTNIKERRDFSCAVLDPRGRLVVNAPHIPVHLGSLGLCVRSLRRAVEMAPGDVVVTNHPAFGGSHLPDVTVVTPVFAGDELVGYVANRAHHAELGGTRPGSMPPRATCLQEEGVVLTPTHLVRRGQPRYDQLRRLLSGGLHPSRAPDDNLADLRAAVAANNLGAEALGRLAAERGPPELARFMDALRARARDHARAALGALDDGVHTAAGALDDGTPLCVSVAVRGASAVVDFAGTAGVHPGNLNATPAIVHGVVIYLLRLLVDRPFPLNEGLMDAVELRIPAGLLDPPFSADLAACPAVVGGNVETSQRLVDLLLAALSLSAGSQGTMNNVLFGAEGGAGYYETVGGGAGAGPGFHGASAVHTHMTNTRITDAEVLEHRYPVRVERFAVRRGSGGEGQYRGGDGVTRELTFLEPMSLSVLSQRRTRGPRGAAGGQPGAPGAQRVVRADGQVRDLASIDGCQVEPGDRLVLETPGGGGWGSRS